jgi:hypothetical protein
MKTKCSFAFIRRTVDIMGDKYLHLDEDTREQLNLPDSERRMVVEESFWIEYEQAEKIIAFLDDLLHLPKKDRMPNCLLIGEANNGKTSLLGEFISRYPGGVREDGSGVDLPIIKINVMPDVDESRLYNRILNVLNAPYKDSEKPDRKQYQVLQLCSRLNVRMLVIDEGSDFLMGTPHKQRTALVAVKDLSNTLKIPVVLSSVPKGLNVINSDSQSSSRFEPVELPLWKNDTEFKRLLNAFERSLPLKKPSFLYSEELASKIHRMTDGIIGDVARLLGKAARLAIDSEEERITEDILDSVRHISPSKRNKG